MNDFDLNFEILNKELYQIFRNKIDCFICSNTIYNPVICRECCTLYCNNCINDNSCPRNCINSVITTPTIHHKELLDQIKVKCKIGGEEDIPLSDAYIHITETCLKAKTDINCWNCNNKAFSNNLKMSHKEKNILDDEKNALFLNYKEEQSVLEPINEKIAESENLFCLEKENLPFYRENYFTRCLFGSDVLFNFTKWFSGFGKLRLWS